MIDSAAVSMADSLAKQVTVLAHDTQHLHELFAWQTAVFGVLATAMFAIAAFLVGYNWFAARSVRKALREEIDTAKSEVDRTLAELTKRLEFKAHLNEAEYSRMAALAMEKLRDYQAAFFWGIKAACAYVHIANFKMADKMVAAAGSLAQSAFAEPDDTAMRQVLVVRQLLEDLPDEPECAQARERIEAILAGLAIAKKPPTESPAGTIREP